MQQGKEKKTDVVIVGGGPVGLAMALLLDRFGVDFVLLERNTTTTTHPKSRGCFARTMELFRQWGIEDKVRARGLPPGTDVFLYVESMAGKEYGRTAPEPDTGLTPAWKSQVAQDVIEEELFAAVRNSKHGKILFGTELLAFEDHGDGISVRSRALDGEVVEAISARYLVAADGAGSNVRRACGITVDGPSTLAVMANDYWRADLSHLPIARQGAGFRVLNEKLGLPPSVILNTNTRDRWLTVSRVGWEKDDRESPWTDEQVEEMARIQTGIPDLKVEVINRDVWRMSRQVACAFRKGNVFLVGDAAHRFPPAGGMGLNSGVQDAHNLAWKLAYVLRGRASDRFLDSYDAERRPVANSNADWSVGNRTRIVHAEDAIRSGNQDNIDFWITDTNRHLHSLGQVLGFSYEQGAVISDGTVPRPLDPENYQPSDRPGSRFPHLWLDTARKHSTLDWFDRDFVLVAGHDGQAWVDAVDTLSGRLECPLQVRKMPSTDARDGFRMGPRGAVIVRPDGHVAWRMPYVPADPAEEITSALQRILSGGTLQ